MPVKHNSLNLYILLTLLFFVQPGLLRAQDDKGWQTAFRTFMGQAMQYDTIGYADSANYFCTNAFRILQNEFPTTNITDRDLLSEIESCYTSMALYYAVNNLYDSAYLITNTMVSNFSSLPKKYALDSLKVNFLLGRIASLEGKTEQARPLLLPYYFQIVSLKDPRPFETAHTQMAVSYYYLTSRKNDSALMLMKEAISNLRKFFGNDTMNRTFAEALKRTGSIYLRNREIELSLPYLHASTTIIDLLTIKNIAFTDAGIYNNYAVTLRMLYQYEEAIDYLKKAYNIIQHFSSTRSNRVQVQVLNNLGATSMIIGSPHMAEEYFLKCLKLEIPNPNKSDINDMLMLHINVGYCYSFLNEEEKSKRYYLKALELSLQYLGNDALLTYESYRFLAHAYFTPATRDSARLCVDEAMRICKKLYNSNSIHYAHALKLKGEYYEYFNIYDSAIVQIDSSIRMIRQIMGPTTDALSGVYELLGQTYFRAKDYQHSLKYRHLSYSRLLTGHYNDTTDLLRPSPRVNKKIAQPLLVDYIRLKCEALFAIANEQDMNHEQRISYLQSIVHHGMQADSVIVQLLPIAVKENDRNKLVKASFRTFEMTIEALYKLKEDANDPTIDTLLYKFISKSKGIGLQNEIAKLGTFEVAGIDPEMSKAYREIRDEISRYELKASYTPASIMADRINERLISLYTKYDSLAGVIRKVYPSYFDLLTSYKGTDIKALQSSLRDSNEIMLDYFLGKERLCIAAITHNALLVKSISIDSSFITLIKDHLFYLKTLDIQQLRKTSVQLFHHLIAPVETLISNHSKLIIIPSNDLSYLPFETIFSPGITVNNTSPGRYLIEDHEIAYHVSADLWMKSNRIQLSGDSLTFLGMAPFCSNDTRWGEVLRSGSDIESMYAFTPGKKQPGHTAAQSTLCHSGPEILDIMRLMNEKDRNVTVFLGSEATKQNFRENIGDFTVAHIASHSIINNDEPQLSKIFFFNDTTSLSSLNDGFLFNNETFNLPNHLSLLVLSSCESGIGQMVKGEGLMSFTRGFLYSGTENIVISLWKVSDKMTSRFMQTFYSEVLAGASYSAALRHAKIKLMCDETTAHPFTWSSFILIGR